MGPGVLHKEFSKKMASPGVGVTVLRPRVGPPGALQSAAKAIAMKTHSVTKTPKLRTSS